MKNRILLFFAVSFFYSLYVVNVSFAGSKKKTCEVIILHTNDMHSKIDNMGRLAYLFDSLKARHPFVFLVSAGDNFTGNPIVDMYPKPGYPMVDLMNMAGFDLSAIGNHEFDMGQVNQNLRRKEAGFPFICANIDVSGSHLKKPKPYFVLRAGKCRIPFLALIQLGENGHPDSHPTKIAGIKFFPGIEVAKDYLRLKEKYGMLIGLTHLGVEDDEPLAQKYPQFDVIIGGHSHTTMTRPMMINNVMVVQTGSGLRNVGKTSLLITDGKITGRDYQLIPLESIKGTRADVQQAIDLYNNNEEMNRTLATAEAPVAGKNELGCLMTDAITHVYKADFAFQNSGGVRISFLPEGEIKYKDVFNLDPFGNVVVTFSMTLPEVKSLIMNSFNRENEPDLHVSGMKYTALVDESGKCVDVEMKDYEGKVFDPDRKYSVGMNSYISASYKFDHADPGTARPETTAQALIEYLKEVKSVNYTGIKRVQVKKK